MPCYDYYREDDQFETQKHNKLRQEMSRLESLLCSACRVLERSSFDFDENPRLSEWWDKHKKEDQARQDRERREELAKKKAFELAENKPIGKLSAEERKLVAKYLPELKGLMK